MKDEHVQWCLVNEAFCKDFTGEFQVCPFSVKISQSAFCKDFTGEFQVCPFSVKIWQNAFCKDFPLFNGFL